MNGGKNYPHWNKITPYHWEVKNLHMIPKDGVAANFLINVMDEMKFGKPSAVVTINVIEDRYQCYDLHMTFDSGKWTGRERLQRSHFHDWLGQERA